MPHISSRSVPSRGSLVWFFMLVMLRKGSTTSCTSSLVWPMCWPSARQLYLPASALLMFGQKRTDSRLYSVRPVEAKSTVV